MGPAPTLLLIVVVVQGVRAMGSNWTVLISSEAEGEKGLCVHLPCRYTLPDVLDPNKTTAIWYKGPLHSPETTVVYHRDPERIHQDYRHRTGLSGDLGHWDCSLFINGLRDGDRGNLSVLIENMGSNRTSNNSVHLNVSDLQLKPNISAPEAVTDNVTATLLCTFPLSCGGQVPELTWTTLDQLNNITTHNRTLNSSLSSTLTFLPSAGDQGKELMCRVRYPSAGAETNRTFRLDVQYGPKIRKLPSVTVDEGDRVQVVCNVSSNPVSVLSWHSLSDGVSMANGSATLWIENVTRQHQGAYMCRAKNRVDKAARRMNITVNYRPSIREMGRTIVVQEGTHLTQICQAEGQPEPNITWSQGSSVLLSKVSDSLVLTIPSVSAGDFGNYTCVAWNRLGSDQRSLLIRTGYAPRNLTVEVNGGPWNHSRVVTEEGDFLALLCSVDSVPASNLTWRVKGVVRNSSESSNSLLLLINGVTYREDGEHRCEASNVLGKAEASVEVSLEYSPKDVAVAVIGGDPPFTEGLNLTLRCWDKANPPSVNTSWYRGDSELVGGGRYFNLGRLAREQEGDYRCSVANAHGSGTSDPYRLSVQYKPEISGESGCTRSPEAAFCVCMVRSYPPGELTWHLPLANLSGNQTHGRFQTWQVADGQLVSSRLTLTWGDGEEDLTVGCKVQNQHGEATFKVYLWVKGQRRAFPELLIPVLGTVAGTLILTLVFCQLAMCCSRRSKRAQRESAEMQALTVVPGAEDGDGGTEEPCPQHRPSDTTSFVTDEEADGMESLTVATVLQPDHNGEVGQVPEDTELHYACIDFSKSPTSDEIVGTRDSTQYAQIKLQ